MFRRSLRIYGITIFITRESATAKWLAIKRDSMNNGLWCNDGKMAENCAEITLTINEEC